ncbi:MAG: hypothetical protein LBK83_14510 [Treponema sp.]|nr:hypothetical protein [Treponema sp.]
MDSELKTGRRIFYRQVEKVEEGKRKRGLLKNLFGFFNLAVYKILQTEVLGKPQGKYAFYG